MKKNIFASLALGFVAFATYLFTMPQSVFVGDSGELATAIYTWGVAHPTGFPVYLITAKLFSYLLPGLEFAHRLNIFSALVASAAVVAVYFILQKLKISFWPATAAALSLAFGYSFWSHAETIQPYSLTALFFVLAIIVFFKFYETGKARHLYILSVVCGLGAGTHLTFLLFLPFAFVYWLVDRNRPAIKLKNTIPCFFVFLFSCSLVYAYISWRAAHSEISNWGDPQTLQNFWRYITQRDYAYKIGARAFQSWKLMLVEVFHIFSREFAWLGFLAAVIGAGIAHKKNRSFFYAGLSVVLFNIILLGNYGNQDDLFVLWRYFLPSMVMLVVFLGYFFFAIPAKLKIFFLLFPAIIFVAHISQLNNRNTVIVQETTKNIFAALPEKSVLIVRGDTLFGSTLYEQSVLRRRQDLLIVSDALYTQPWYLASKKKETVNKDFQYADNLPDLVKINFSRGVYSVANNMTVLKSDYDFLSMGIIYQLAQKNIGRLDKEKNINFWNNLDIGFLANKNLDKDYFLNELVGLYTAGLNNFASAIFNDGATDEGIRYFEQSLSVRENKNALYNLAGIYNAMGEAQKAAEYKKRFDTLK
jgi:hypothetical protein